MFRTNIIEVHESVNIWPHGKNSAKRCTVQWNDGKIDEVNIRNEEVKLAQTLAKIKSLIPEELLNELVDNIEEYGQMKYNDCDLDHSLYIAGPDL